MKKPRYINFGEVKRQADMMTVLQSLGWTYVVRKGDQCRGKCPLHVSSTGKGTPFSANLKHKCFQCFRCKAKGDILDLVSQVLVIPVEEAAVEIAEICGLKSLL